MAQKERYEFGQRTLFDNRKELTTFDGFNLDDFMGIICNILNQQDKYIKDLEDQIEQMTQDYASEIAYWTGASESRIAVEELRKVKNLLQNAINLEKFDLVGLYDAINNQIKKLGGENK